MSSSTQAAAQPSRVAVRAHQIRSRPNFNSSTEFVTFTANKDNVGVKFVIHKEFACHYSKVLKTAFASSFIEGESQTYTFPDYGEEVLRLLVGWIYSTNLVMPEWDNIFFEDTNTDYLTQLWVLADQLKIPQLQNCVVRKLKDITDSSGRIPTHCLDYVYQNTGVDSKLRTWYMHRCAKIMRPYFWSSQNFPPTMLQEVVAYLAERKPEFQRPLFSDDDLTRYEVPEVEQ
ncbi:uncharacterized protein LY89DRAFT_728911 [Mollisia scopiformis]|uniref:BTB domain-containing protein n=1 Tax=Mollisia scopiformis TaxID=149040 RepID=A0A194XSU1_MOLSC|nr:uncharacterized protein LY89DRAFT_728911 [Mollisia scopiformis]KUJ22797.1 hypothetical protein LY89DRAFT_728911 [Mollisia scopiformis]